MSMTGSSNGLAFSAGRFLADDEQCVRQTATIAATHAAVVTKADGTKYVPAGSAIPANGSTAKGILYEDIDVTDGDAMGSIVTEGTVYEDLLPAQLESSAKSAMTGIKVIANHPTVTRPDLDSREFGKLSVTSAAGTASGDTAITVSGYELAAGDSYKYKVGDTAPAAVLGEPLPSGFTAWDGDDDITAATNKKITVAVVSAGGYVLAAGSATVTANS